MIDVSRKSQTIAILIARDKWQTTAHNLLRHLPGHKASGSQYEPDQIKTGAPVQDSIIIRGAREHNLKDLNVCIL